MRLCKPPLSLTTFCIIHDTAEPQITTTTLLIEAQLFQKTPKAFKKPDFGVSNQDSSSKKRLFSYLFLWLLNNPLIDKRRLTNFWERQKPKKEGELSD